MAWVITPVDTEGNHRSWDVHADADGDTTYTGDGSGIEHGLQLYDDDGYNNGFVMWLEPLGLKAYTSKYRFGTYTNDGIMIVKVSGAGTASSAATVRVHVWTLHSIQK